MAGSFPATRYSVVRAVASDDEQVRRVAYEALVSSYWRPVYKYLRLKWRLSPEDAEDTTQAFFTRALEKGFFDRFDARKARFRTFLRTCLDGFAANERKAAERIKRGGGVALQSLDFRSAEGELVPIEIRDEKDTETYFQQEWARSLFAASVDALRESCERAGKQAHFALFERYDIEGSEAGANPSYESLARELGLPVTQVTNHLAWARREFRRLVLAQLREVVASDEEFRAEARSLLGVDPA